MRSVPHQVNLEAAVEASHDPEVNALALSCIPPKAQRTLLDSL